MKISKALSELTDTSALTDQSEDEFASPPAERARIRRVCVWGAVIAVFGVVLMAVVGRVASMYFQYQ